MPSNTETNLLVNKKRYDVVLDGLKLSFLIDEKSNAVVQAISQMTLHIHSHAELFVCNSGQISISTPDGIITVEAGKALVVPPLFPHSKIADGKQTDKWCAVGFSCLFKGNRQSEHTKALLSLGTSEKPFLIDAGESFAKEVYSIVKNDDGSSDYLPALRLTTEICKILPNVHPHSEKHEQQTSSTNENIDRLAMLDYLIYARFMEDVRLDKIAKELFICERQLARIVKAAYGTTLHSLINNRRLETATKLLIETDICAESIGYCVGYKSKTAFYNEFKKRFGMTPIAYRNENASLRPKVISEIPLNIIK